MVVTSSVRGLCFSTLLVSCFGMTASACLGLLLVEKDPITQNILLQVLAAEALGASLLFGVMYFRVKRRLATLGNQLRMIHETGQLSTRLDVGEEDEIRHIASSVNSLVASLETSTVTLKAERRRFHEHALRFAGQVETLSLCSVYGRLENEYQESLGNTSARDEQAESLASEIREAKRVFFV